jgi:hypothetical protein
MASLTQFRLGGMDVELQAGWAGGVETSRAEQGECGDGLRAVLTWAGCEASWPAGRKRPKTGKFIPISFCLPSVFYS